MKMNISTLEKLNYEGQDVCLKTSLGEYGLAWKEFKRTLKKRGVVKGELHVIVGTCVDDNCNYTEFATGYITRDDLVDLDWVEYDKVGDSVGVSADELLAYETSQLMECLFGYYGACNFRFNLRGGSKIGGLAE